MHYEDQHLWVPRQCTIRWYGAPGVLQRFTAEPPLTTTVTLSELSFRKREDVSFELRGDEPGSPAIHRTTETAKDAQTKPETTAGPAYARPPRAPEAAADARPAGMPWVIIINVAVFVAIGSCMAYRLLRRRS